MGDKNAWILRADCINEMQNDSIKKLVRMLKHAHMCDVIVRINGEDVRIEADWIKSMKPQEATATPPADAALADEDTEAVISCLEDDAATLRGHEDGWEEIARNMDDAAEIIRQQAAALRGHDAR